jgi:CheY-like chemotaxis protein
MDMEEMLLELGADTVVTSHSLDHAHDVLKTSTPDIAVHDINLGKDTTAEIASALTSRGVAFIFSTGYREGTGIPTAFASSPVVRKPTSVEALSAGLRQALVTNV